MPKVAIEEIRELALIIKKANVNSLELFSSDDFIHKKNLMTKLFHILCKYEIKNLSQLQELLSRSRKSSEISFNRLFYRFREKLLNTLFFIDTNSSLFGERAKAYYLCSKRTVLVRMISQMGLKEFSQSIAESTLRVSLKYEFTELTLLLSRLLINQIGVLNIKNKSYFKYKSIFNKSKEMYYRELELSEKSSELISYINSTHKLINNPLKSSEFENIVKLAWKYIKDDPSIELIKHCLVIILNYNKENKHFIEYKKNTFYFLKMIFKKQFLSNNALEFIISELFKVSLITKDIKTANKIRVNYFQYININDFNWFVINFGYIHTLFHCRDYNSCWKEISGQMSNRLFKKQPPVIKQNFYVLQAYAHFLYKIGKISGVTNAKEFRVYKFLNEVPEYSRDKQGVNIPIILVQILFFLADQNHHLIIDRIDSLKLYAYRYLKKDENFRSQCFIRMLGEMVRAGFKRQGTLFRTKALMDKLKLVPIDTYPATAENEIIPYEDLWEMVLGLLK